METVREPPRTSWPGPERTGSFGPRSLEEQLEPASPPCVHGRAEGFSLETDVPTAFAASSRRHGPTRRHVVLQLKICGIEGGRLASGREH